jgi:hypothetical protein
LNYISKIVADKEKPFAEIFPVIKRRQKINLKRFIIIN